LLVGSCPNNVVSHNDFPVIIQYAAFYISTG